MLDWLEKEQFGGEGLGVGHRVVHGGPDYAAAAAHRRGPPASICRPSSLWRRCTSPYNLAGIEAAMQAFPEAAQVACFDTAFHRKHPYIADTFALPRKFYDEGVRRYGFHGLSYEFINRILRHEEPVLARGKVIVAHLGNGASLCAIDAGSSVASTMGFTALDGVPMGTRCGQLDPGVVLYLMSEKEDEPGGDHRPALQGIPASRACRAFRTTCASSKPRTAQSAKDAIDYFVSRVRREIGGLSAVLGGLDCIVLTGGIGENAWRIRHATLKDMEWFGIHIDREANAAERARHFRQGFAHRRADPEDRRGADDRRPHGRDARPHTLDAGLARSHGVHLSRPIVRRPFA